MASIIRIKRSNTAGNPSTLGNGELAYSALAGSQSNGGDRLYIGFGSETNGNAADHIVIGGKYFTDMLDHVAGTLTANSAIIVDGDKKVDVFNVDNLRLDGNTLSSTNTNGDITIQPNGTGAVNLYNPYIDQNGTLVTLTEFIQDVSGGGIIDSSEIDATYDDAAGTTSLALKTTGVTAGSYGSTTKIPTFTVDSKGRLSAAGEVDVGTQLTVAGDSTSDTIDLLTDTLSILGGAGLSTAISNNSLTVSIDNTGVTAGSYGSASQIPTFTVNSRGQLTAAGTVDVATVLNIQGDSGTDGVSLLTDTLTFAGTNGLTATVGDNSVTFTTDATASNTAGAIVKRDSNGDFSAHTITANLVGNASTATTLQTARTITLSGDVAGSVSFDGSANVNIAATIQPNSVSLGDDTTGNYVATITGTANQVIVSGSGTETAAVTLSLPQDIDSSATPTFAGASFTNDVSMGSSRITGLADPVDDQDAATKAYVDAARSGLDVKQSVRAATTANITLSGTQTIDGVALSVGDRVLVKNQTDATKNGIYIVAAGAWSRATDADEPNEVSPGLFLFVEEGTVNADNGFVITSDAPLAVGTDPLTFTQFSGAGMIIAGDALTKSGNRLDVVVAASGGIEIVSDALQLKSSVAGNGLAYSSGVLSIASSAAGDGLAYSNGVISVNTANGIEVSSDNVQLASTVAGNGLTYTSGVLDIVGTANRISVSADAIDIASTYIGQTSITTLGTITTGTWTGDVIADAYIAQDLTISGGTINSTPIGATGRSTGAFTTLAANGAVSFTSTLAVTGNTTVGGTLGVTGNVTMNSMLSVGGNVMLSANLTGAGAGTSTIDGFQIDGGTY